VEHKHTQGAAAAAVMPPLAHQGQLPPQIIEGGLIIVCELKLSFCILKC
jgi:hypothetical protein